MPILYENNVNIWIKILEFIPEFELIIDEPDYLYDFYRKTKKKITAYELAKKIIDQRNIVQNVLKYLPNSNQDIFTLIYSYFPTAETYEQKLKKQYNVEIANLNKHFTRNGDPKLHPVYFKVTLPSISHRKQKPNYQKPHRQKFQKNKYNSRRHR